MNYVLKEFNQKGTKQGKDDTNNCGLTKLPSDCQIKRTQHEETNICTKSN